MSSWRLDVLPPAVWLPGAALVSYAALSGFRAMIDAEALRADPFDALTSATMYVAVIGLVMRVQYRSLVRGGLTAEQVKQVDAHIRAGTVPADDGLAAAMPGYVETVRRHAHLALLLAPVLCAILVVLSGLGALQVNPAYALLAAGWLAFAVVAVRRASRVLRDTAPFVLAHPRS